MEKNIAEATGNVFQERNVTYPDYCPEIEQMYFEFEDSFHTFQIGVKTLLECLSFAVRQGEIPEPSTAWLTDVCARYGTEPSDWHRKD